MNDVMYPGAGFPTLLEGERDGTGQIGTEPSRRGAVAGAVPTAARREFGRSGVVCGASCTCRRHRIGVVGRRWRGAGLGLQVDASGAAAKSGGDKQAGVETAQEAKQAAGVELGQEEAGRASAASAVGCDRRARRFAAAMSLDS